MLEKFNTLFNDIFYNKIKDYLLIVSIRYTYISVRWGLILSVIVYRFVNGDFNDNNHSQTFWHTEPLNLYYLAVKSYHSDL